MLILSAVRQGC